MVTPRQELGYQNGGLSVCSWVVGVLKVYSTCNLGMCPAVQCKASIVYFEVGV